MYTALWKQIGQRGSFVAGEILPLLAFYIGGYRLTLDGFREGLL